jgi:hypothetical protein
VRKPVGRVFRRPGHIRHSSVLASFWSDALNLQIAWLPKILFQGSLILRSGSYPSIRQLLEEENGLLAKTNSHCFSSSPDPWAEDNPVAAIAHQDGLAQSSCSLISPWLSRRGRMVSEAVVAFLAPFSSMLRFIVIHRILNNAISNYSTQW